MALCLFHVKLCADARGEISISGSQNSSQRPSVRALLAFGIRTAWDGSRHHLSVSTRGAFVVGVQREIEVRGHVRPPLIRRQWERQRDSRVRPQRRFVSWLLPSQATPSGKSSFCGTSSSSRGLGYRRSQPLVFSHICLPGALAKR